MTMETFAWSLEIFLLRAALLLTFFWGAYACLKSHPRARVMLCRVTSVMLVVLPLLGLMATPRMVSVPSLPEMEVAWPISKPKAPEASANLPVHNLVTSSVAPTTSGPQPISLPTWTFSEALALVWGMGAGILLARWLTAFVLAQRLLASSRTPPDWVDTMGTNLCGCLNIRRFVQVSVLDRARSPLLIGPRPVILLPRHLFDSQEHEDIISVLAHELVHVKEQDWCWSQWQHIVTSLIWPIPFSWFLRRAHDAASELVCDHEAALLSGGAKSYASVLARQSLQALGHPQLATMPMLRRSGIRQRIDLLLSGAVLPPLSRHAITAAAFSALILGGLLAGIHLAHADDADNEVWSKHQYLPQEIQKIASKTFSYFQSVSSLSYTGTEVSSDGTYTHKTTFIGSGDRYVIKTETIRATPTGEVIKPTSDDDAASNFRRYIAFNGEYYQELEYHLRESDLHLGKGPPFLWIQPKLFLLRRASYFTMPFDYVGMADTGKDHNAVVLTPYLYQRPENWLGAERIKSFQNGSLRGKKGLVMKLTGDFDGPVDITVLLDPSINYYPVIWEINQPGSNNTMSYVVTEVGTISSGNESLPYPKAATLVWWNGAKLTALNTITIDQASINEVNLDDPRFTINPKEADFVIDHDKQTKIAVAK
jgi:beta-lactamase regulating signal transducer with metallopeptidase domain